MLVPFTDAEAEAFLNRVEDGIVALGGTQELPLFHEFTNSPQGGIYTRTIYIPQGTLLTSQVHDTCHPFFVMMGDILVWSKEHGTTRYTAPDRGITTPGTRRLLYALESTVWITIHAWNGPHDPRLVEAEILRPHPNSLDLKLPALHD
jgi:hypothetical protein